MSTTLTFYGGVNEIGGNKILVEDNGTKIFLDFGMSFKLHSMFFEEFLKPRTANGIGDFFATNLLPDIEGIYRTDLLLHLGRKEEDPEIDAVVLSHAHADHANYISFLHKDIPVYCGETCKSILDAIEESGQRDLEKEVVNFKPRPLFRAHYRDPPIQRNFEMFRTGHKFKIGSLEIEPIHVDHSVPGSYGFLIWASAGPIVYTGDMRLHGTHSEMTMDFVNRAKEVKPIAMITEGTRIDVPKTDECESKVYNDSKNKILGFSGLVFVDFNFKDVDRFNTFYQIAKETGRNIVIGFKHACFLERYHQDKNLKTPDSRAEGVFIFKPKQATGTYSDEDYTDAHIKCRLDYPNVITAEVINKNPEKYIVVLGFFNINNLIDFDTKNSLYIKSSSEPYNEEMEISYERMQNWLNHFNLNLFQSHCSGHMVGQDLKELINLISPKVLFPIHTEHPRMFRDLSTKAKIVKLGKKCIL